MLIRLKNDGKDCNFAEWLRLLVIQSSATAQRLVIQSSVMLKGVCRVAATWMVDNLILFLASIFYFLF